MQRDASSFESAYAAFSTLCLICAVACAGEQDAAGADAGADDALAALPCKTAADCPDPGPCQGAVCGDMNRCEQVLLVDGVTCDDGDPCTNGDVCASGACKPGLFLCQCTKTDDCAPFEDGDLCNGTLFCDLALDKPVCVVNPSTLVVCSVLKDTACLKSVCAAATGQCALTPLTGDNCDDGDPCTADKCDQQGTCVPGTDTCPCKVDADCADDTNKCNGTPYCDVSTAPYSCKTNPGTVVDCGSGSPPPCHVAACLPATGECGNVPDLDKTPCEDGETCTAGDACSGGSCEPGQWVCSCSENADCAKLDGPDFLCTGSHFCHLSSGQCALNPATTVVCTISSDTACTKNMCKSDTGVCQMTAANEAEPCDDGNPCTAGGACKKGQCKTGPKDQICPCKTGADCAAKEDGDLCNGTLFCDMDTGTCKVNPASLTTCFEVDNTDCSKSVCVPKTGKCAPKPLPDETKCDADGNPCSLLDTCQGGKCVAAANTCGCQTDADCLAKEDGNQCNGTLFCDKSGAKPVCSVNPATSKTCPTVDNTDCMTSLCMPKTGACALVAASDGLPCEEGNACTAGDHCSAGSCVAGPNSCACAADADCAKFDDGDACNGGKYCHMSGGVDGKPACLDKPNSAIVCSQAGLGPCVANVCQPESGKCSNKDKTGACTDDDPCTSDDGCVTGTCKGKGKDCDDKDACTKDSCDPGVGACVNLANAATCNDGNVCTQANCDPNTGNCVQLPFAATCSDGDVCTAADICADGACKAGAVVKCDDGNSCTEDACDAKTGCKSTAVADGTACFFAGKAGLCDAVVCKAKGDLFPAALPVNLGTAGQFAILAKAAISTVPASVVTGDIGVSPAAATYITGFSLAADGTNVFSTATQVVGKVYAANYAIPTPAKMTAAIGHMELAYLEAAARPPDATELGAGDIGGKTIPRGVYKWGTGLLIPTNVTLSGSATDVWIFQIAQNLTVSGGAKVLLTGGAVAKNVFWAVAGHVDLGTTSHVEGAVLCKTAITLHTGASVNGRLLAQTAANIAKSVVTAPAP